MLTEKVRNRFVKAGTLIVGTVFCIGICFILSKAKTDPIRTRKVEILNRLLNGNDADFRVPGSQFQAFKESLPKKGTFSFLMDRAFDPYDTMIESLYAAQAYLAPLLINPKPDEKIAIVYCSNQTIAEERMKQEGYQPISMNNGKGLAIKTK